MKKINELILRHKQILKYLSCSIFTAVVETVAGYYLKGMFSINIVVANTISIFVGMIIHYVLVSKTVFERDYDLWSIFVYAATFLIGIVLQNAIICVAYEALRFRSIDFIRYVLSKGFSLGIPFFAIYYLRKKLYSLKGFKKG